MNRPTNAFLFDIGNVILGFDFNIAVRKLRDFGITHKEPFAYIAEVKNRYEAGEYDDEEFVELAMGQLGFNGSSGEFVTIWQQIFHENTAMAETIRDLAKGERPLYLLSNTNGLHIRHILRDYPIFQAFAGGIYSHEAKSMKPAPAMFQQAIARFGLIPEETLYIDDLPANIETGRALGFKSHLYDPLDHQALLDILD